MDASTPLRELGLDSLGATALLGILKANLVSARHLSLPRLAAMETVDHLVVYLQEHDETAVAKAKVDADDDLGV